MTIEWLEQLIEELSLQHQTRPSRYLWCRLIEAYHARAVIAALPSV